MENLKNESLEFATVKDFLTDLKQEFGNGNNKLVKIAELKNIEKRLKTIKEFVQKFRRVARESSFERRLLIEEFKREMNGVISRKLIKTKYSPRSIEQWYERVTNLDRHWRESRREEKRLRNRRKIENQAPRTNMPANAGGV